MNHLSELRWKCRRGMKELDMVLRGYLETHYTDSDEIAQRAFMSLLDMQDPELYFLVLGKTVAKDSNVAAVVDVIRSTPNMAS